MPDTQDKIGFLREDSRNATKRGGREVPDEPQTKIGTLHSENRQDKPRGGAEPGDNTSTGGIREPILGEQSIKRTNDHIRKIADEY